MNSLTPDWKFLRDLLLQIDRDPKKKISVRLLVGLPYLCIRLALLGWSSFVVSSEERAETFSEDVKSFRNFFDSLQEWSLGFFPEDDLKERSALLEEASQNKGIIWFGTEGSLKKSSLAKDDFLNLRLKLKVGKTFPYSKLLNHFSNHGYRRSSFVEEIGEFALRGELFDFWSPNSPKPVRLIFSNDVIESLHFFEPSDQRTVCFVPETVVLPLSERTERGCLPEHFPKNTLLIFDSLPVASGEWRKELREEIEKFPIVEISVTGINSELDPVTPIHLNWNFLKEELRKNLEGGIRNFVFCRNMGESERLEEILHELRCSENEKPQILIAPLSQGFVNPQIKISVWSFSDLTGSSPSFRKLPTFKMGRAFDLISEVQPGDYVVHESFGIGRYRGLERIHLKLNTLWNKTHPKEKESEFLVLEYLGGDRLLVPIQDFRLIQKYVGSEGKKPRLYSLDGIAWERVKQKVRKEVTDLAQDLLKTAAFRETAVRLPSQRESHQEFKENLYKEFVDAFPYEETPDQLKTIKEIEKDLESNHLFDRLVCGDVGYGKTEIAMRAAFKVACDSKQVAILVPTTILAEQHFKTFSERFAAFPIKIGMLSRFQNRPQQEKIIQDLKNGTIDILIGTHRLIQKDVQFKNLQLVIIDEEHRFGVQQKEVLKNLKLTTDVLSLTATPIPRTLSLAMGSIRDISIIETPPEGRLPIETFVGIFEIEKLREAVEREIGRNGQIFYVHNRVATIKNRKEELEKLFPTLRIELAHGQMSSESLEKAMWNFMNGKWDILLSTSIIESGLDIPNVNTLIVEDSDEFGLAQLYQLRGRVGRKREKAHCYLFFSDWKTLSKEAQKRLNAIQEFSTLGSGFKLALRDLEIRGTGNILGSQQHGWISAVGLDLYCHLLSEEVTRLKAEKGFQVTREVIPSTTSTPPTSLPAKPELSLPEIELNLSAFIPEEYVESPGERISLYKKIIDCATVEEAEKLALEFLDRFGPIPEPCKTLFKLVRLKFSAQKLNVVSISETEEGIVISWEIKNGIIPLDLVRFAQDFSDLIEILPIPPTLTTLSPPSPPSPSFRRSGEKEMVGSLAPKKGILKILFRDNQDEEIFSTVEKFLRVSSKYVIV